MWCGWKRAWCACCAKSLTLCVVRGKKKGEGMEGTREIHFIVGESGNECLSVTSVGD